MPHHIQEMSGGLEAVGDVICFPSFLNSQGQNFLNTQCIFKKCKMKVVNNFHGVCGREREYGGIDKIGKQLTN